MSPAAHRDAPCPRGGVSRRTALVSSGLAALGAAATATAVGAGAAAAPAGEPVLVPFHGRRQAGVETPPQHNAAFCGFDLRDGTDRAAAVRLLRLLTDDAARLTAARPALVDQEPELATVPARLTVTVGFGPGFFTRLGLTDRVPTGFAPLPPYPIDRLQPEWGQTDLLLQCGADDPLVLSHAVRQLSRTTRSFATARWTQYGFRSRRADVPQRNLFGQIEGTGNPAVGTDDAAAVVWSQEPGWFADGTMMVLRRIAMHLDTWDELDVSGKELALGRRLATGAPLTGTRESDPLDLTATDTSGLPITPAFAHVARAAARHGSDRFLRRPYNYDDGLTADGAPDVGLLFATYQADLSRQYLPVQERLAQQDLLNEWTTPIGSAVYALPPGCGPDGFLGAGLLG